MLRSPGGLYKSLTRELKGIAWRARIGSRAGIEVVEVPSLKEAHILVGKSLSFKIVEKR